MTLLFDSTAIQDFFETFNKNCAQVIIPDANLAIDDTLYPYKGRNKLKQYNPSKPAKYCYIEAYLAEQYLIHILHYLMLVSLTFLISIT